MTDRYSPAARRPMASLYLWSLRNLARHRSRTLLTLLGLALGVAALFGVAILRETALHSVAGLFDQAAGRADLSVTNTVAGIVGGEGFDAAALEQVRAVAGVEVAAPLLQIVTLPTSQLDDWRYSLSFGNFDGAVIYGLDPAASREVGHYHLAAGRDLAPDDEQAILLTTGYAAELGLALGDEVVLAAPVGQARFTLAGLLADQGLARLNRCRLGIVSLAAAQARFGRPGRLDQIDIVAAPGRDPARLQRDLQQHLGTAFRLFAPATQGDLISQTLQALIVTTGFVAALSLAVAAFLVYNTFSMAIAERGPELGLLRALGAGRAQIAGLILAEAGLLGLAAGVLGLLPGLGLALALRHQAGEIVNSDIEGLVILPGHVLATLLLGLLVALAGALAPALHAARLPADATIRRSALPRSRYPAGWLLALAGLVFTVAAGPARSNLTTGLLALVGSLALLAGVTLLLPAAIPSLERMAGTVMGILGLEGRLGGRNLARRPGRSALTAGALIFGLAAVMAIAAVAASIQALGLEFTAKTLSADLWVFGPQPLPAGLAAEIQALPQVQIMGSGRPLPTRLVPPDPDTPEVAIVFTAFDLHRAAEFDLLLAPGGGTQAEVIARLAQGGAVLLASPLRERYGLDVGDTVRLHTLQGLVDFEVAGILLDLSANGYAVHGTWPDAARYFGTDEPTILAVHVTPGSDPAGLGQHILDRWGSDYNLRFETLAQLEARVEQQSWRLTALYNSVVLVGVAVAALGVANTLLVNVLDRRREIGLLRAAGMTRGQVMRLVLAEAAALGGLGGLLGLGLGTWLSYVAVTGSTILSGYDLAYTFPLGAALACLAITAVVPPLAGLWPAWRAARVNVVDAVRTE